MNLITEKEIKAKLSVRLKTERRKLDKSQQEIADMLEQTRPAYGKYETERSLPQALGIARMAQIFNVTADYMLGLTDEPGAYNYSTEAVNLLKIYDKLDKETQAAVNDIINRAINKK